MSDLLSLGNPTTYVSLVTLALAAIFWKFLKKLFGKVTDHFINRAVDETVKSFQGKTSKWMPNLFGQSGLKLNHDKLMRFYGKETPIRISVAGEIWDFPATLFIAPIGSGEISEQNIKVVVEDSLFELDAMLDKHTEKFIDNFNNAGLYNGEPWAIKTVSDAGGSRVITLHKCKYFDSLRTNFALDLKVLDGSQSLRSYLHRASGKFDDFNTSRLPNHCGVVAMIETSDGQLIVQKRSKDVAIRPNTLSSSASGTIEDDDYVIGEPDQSLEGVGKSIRRETLYELGVEFAELKFLGLIREMKRGGFPDFYFFGKINETFSQVKASSKTSVEASEINGLQAFDFRSVDFLSDPRHEQFNFEVRILKILTETNKKGNLTLALGVALTADHFLAQSGVHGKAHTMA